MKKKLLIIGGNSALSRSFQKHFKNKYQIYLTSKNKNILHKRYFNLDLTYDNSIIKFYNSIKKIKFDNILICPGIIYGKKLTNYTFEKIDELFSINSIGIIKLLSKMLKRGMKSQTNIIFISSISERKGSFDEIYASSKSSLSKIAKSLSINFGKSLRVNVIAPSVIKSTKMYKMMKKKNISRIKKNTPNNKILDINDLSKIVNDVFQDHWRHSNGAIIDVNGGLY